MGLPTPKTHVKGLLQVMYCAGLKPLHLCCFQSNAKSVVKQAYAWKAEGHDVWIEVANTVESAVDPRLEWWYKGGPVLYGVELGREDALKGRTAESNPYLSETMKAEWLAGWEAGMKEQGKLPLQYSEPKKARKRR